MSRELFYQSLILKVVKEMGGQGFKLANRFKAGVPDLFIKLPDKPALMVEVKYDEAKRDTGRVITNLDLSILQEKFLRDYSEVGMDVAAVKVVEYQKDVFIAMTWKGFFEDRKGVDYGQPMGVPWSRQCSKKNREKAIQALLMER